MEHTHLVIQFTVPLSKQCFHKFHMYTCMLRRKDSIVFEVVFVNASKTVSVLRHRDTSAFILLNETLMYIHRIFPGVFLFCVSFPFDQILDNLAPSEPA